MFASLFRMTLAIIALYGILGSGNAFADDLTNTNLAKNTAPNFWLEGDKKKTVSLSDYRGHIVYVDFWASWCQPCRKSFTWMNKMQSLYGSEGLKIIAINLDEERDKAEQFLQKIPANFDIAYDPQGMAAEAYSVQAMPSSYLIDKQGRLIHANKGFRGNDEDELEAKIRHHIRQSTVASTDLR